MSQRPEEVKLTREEGEELIERLETDRVTASDRDLLVKLIRLYFWLSFALQETKISLKRLKIALFGEGRKAGQTRQSDKEPPCSEGGGTGPDSNATTDSSDEANEADEADEAGAQGDGKGPGSGRGGHGRQGAQAYTGAQVLVCRHEEMDRF